MRNCYTPSFFKSLFLFAFATIATLSTKAQTYCTTGLYTTGCVDDQIVSFSTTGGITNITNNNSGCGGGAAGYTFYNTMTHSTTQGGVVNFSITSDPSWTEGYKIWVDYNNDGDFDDAGENVYDPATTTPAGSVITGNFTVPVSTIPGIKRMRVRCVFSSAAFTPCSSVTYGEVEDYNLQVISLTPCSGIPNAGTVSANPISGCVGVPINLTSAGIDVTASGLKYQWQVSTDNGVTWSSPVTDTFPSLTTTQTATSQYRIIVVCTSVGGGADTSNVVTVVSPPIPGGNYTINKNLATDWPSGTNFNNFADAYASLSCGISAPVIFNVVPGSGPYNEQLIVNGKISGASATNTITFKGNGETISFNSTNTNERAVIKIKNTRYFVFDSLVVNAGGGTYGFGFHITSDADSNVIKKCTINTNATATTANYAGIVISGADNNAIGTGTTTALCDANIVDSNTVNGGMYGITLTATFSGGANGFNRITNNTIKDFYTDGIHVIASYNTVIEKNTITRPTRTNTATTVNGIVFSAQNNGPIISKNKIYEVFKAMPTSTSAFNGIYFNASSPSAGNDYIVTNNVVAASEGNGNHNGILNSGTNSIQMMHNTISLDNITSTTTPSTTTRGYNQTGSSTGIIFYNNIISVTRTGSGPKYCIYAISNATVPFCDYNDYYINGASNHYIGFNGANRQTMSAWVTATSQDLASLNFNPVFSGSVLGDYAPVNAAIDNKALAGLVPDDINNVTRNATTPDMGAYEFTAPICTVPPAAGPTIILPDSTCQNTPVLLNVTLGQYGSGQTFQWQRSNTLNGTYTDVGNPKATPDTTINADTTGYYRCAITCGGVTVYSDSIRLKVMPSLPAGVYTINSALPTSTNVPHVNGDNFQTFNDTRIAMGCGILGAVTFNVTPNSGPYNEQLILDSIAGTSVVNTVTYNGNGNTLAFAPTNANQRAVLKLNGADYLIFDSLTIDASAATSFGYAVQLINRADTNIIRKSTLLANSTSTGANFAGLVINSAHNNSVTLGNTFCDGNKFDKNIISGGYYGVTLVGHSAELINDNEFTNNEIKDFYNYGMYIAGTANTLIQKNSIHRSTRSSVSNGYGIYVTAAKSDRLFINKNRIYNFFGGAPTSTLAAYGIYHNNVSLNAGNENNVVNNLIYSLDANSGSSASYGIYNASTAGVNYFHNTIAIDNTTSTSTGVSTGFYQSGTALGIQFINNIVTVSRGGTGAKYAIQLLTTANNVVSNNNVFYMNAAAGIANYIGRFGSTNHSDLAAWKAASGGDANSLSEDPIFGNASSGNYKPQALSIDNKGTNSVAITTDIEDATRSTTTPDIGAYEFSPSPCPSPLLAGTATVTPNVGMCLEMPISLNLTGNSALGSVTFQWQASASGNPGSWINIGQVQFTPKFDTLSSVTNYYRCIIMCTGGLSDTSSVVQVNLNAILPAGSYTIDGTQPTNWPTPNPGPNANFNSFTDAVLALKCGIKGHVVFNVKAGTYNEQIRIPYVPGTSAANGTVTFQAENGNPTSAILTYAATSSTTNYTLKLDSAQYIYFRNLTINATGSSFGKVVEFANTASFDSLTNCIINAPVVTNTSINFAAVSGTQLKGSNISIKGNTINNGSVGIYLTGASAANKTFGHTIDSNTVSGFYQYGTYVMNGSMISMNKNTITLAAPTFSTSYGMYVSATDSTYQVSSNKININNTVGTAYGIWITGSGGTIYNDVKVMNNDINANTGNTSILYGMRITNSPNILIANNAIVANTSSSCYGLYIDNSGSGKYYNNSINSLGTSLTNSYGLYVSNASAIGIELKNNILSNKGGGKAMFVTNPAGINSNYNMLYTTGTVLVQRGTPNTPYPNLLSWFNAAMQDRYSISYNPAFTSDNDLRPDLNNHEVWAIHGRGTQLDGNDKDHDGNTRSTTLIAGVPDLGAYEFYPIAQPTVLGAVPANPAPNTTQTFYYGTDTVMRITWKSTAPTSIELRRFSGVVPEGLKAANLDSMYFYVQSTIPGGGNYDYDAKLYYLDPWLGSIQSPSQLGIGRTSPSNAWLVGVNSRNELAKRMLYDNEANYLDRFTGLFNPYAPPVIPDRDSSNRGRHFYFLYAANQLNAGATQEMTYYVSTFEEPANVTIKVNGTSWTRSFLVPPYTVNAPLPVDYLPKNGANVAFYNVAGITDRSVEIISDVPVVAYAHGIGSTSSGGCMLLPVGVWGYEYKTLTITQDYGANSFSLYYVVAANDNTKVEVTSVAGVATQNLIPPIPPGTPTFVTLNKGEVLQVLATSQTQELSGSLVKSVPNANGECFPIAVFSGSSRTAIDMPSGCSSGGDFSMQQNFPITAWGKRYLLAPTSFSPAPFNTAANPFATNTYRIAVQDPATVVLRDGVPLTGIVNNHYYQFHSNQPSYIESDKPIMIAQFTSGGTCLGGPSGSVGDPEMLYISPIEQGIKEVGFYRNTAESIDVNYLTMVVPTAALPSLKIYDNNIQQTPDYTYVHPASITNYPSLKGVSYTVVIKRWTSAQRQVRVVCDSAFTGITYGLGSVESYGYNMGTLVKNLRASGSGAPTSTSGTSNAPAYTCSGTPTKITMRIGAIPTSITWKFSNVPNVTPNVDIIDNNPTPTDSAYDSNGDRVYYFTLNQSYTFSTPGLFTVPVTFTAPTIGSCDNSQTDLLYIHVIPSPSIGFNVAFAGCVGNTATFTADPATPGGVNANQWNWTFHDATTATGQNSTYTYNAAGTFPVKLDVVTADGCIGDSSKNIIVNPLPTVDAVIDLIQICSGENATFNVLNPDANYTYNWYNSATSTTILFTGTTYALTNVTATQEYYIEAVNNITNCVSGTRKKVKVEIFNLLTAPIATVSNVTQNSITFTWPSVAGAVGYEVSSDNGTTWITPSSGSTGLTHTISGLAPSTTVTLIVRALGTLGCQKNTSTAVTGTTLAVYQVYVPNAFNPSSTNVENRTFKIYGSVKNMTLMVFNQWGEKVFESNTPTPGWDGTYKGKPLPSGVYIYVLKYTLIDDKTGEKKGSLNLIR
jgi:gliding motility-associated-like protein